MNGQNSNTAESKKPFIFHDHICGMVPFRIAKDLDLNATQLRIYIFIAGLKFQMEDVYVTNEDFCTQLGIKEESKMLQKYMREMKKKGYLRREKREVERNGKKFKAWCWDIGSPIILSDKVNQEEVFPENTFDDNNDERGVPPEHVGGVPPEHLNKRKKIKENIISESGDSPLVSPEGLVQVYMEELPMLAHPRDPKKLNKELVKTLNALIKRWSIDISDKGNALTYDIFRAIIKKLKEIDYWMFRPEKDAGIKVFCRITNMQQAVEKIIAHEKQERR